jgi:hypothetical protein
VISHVSSPLLLIMYNANQWKGYMVTLIILASAEMFIIIIAATIPTLKPLTRWGRQSSRDREAEVEAQGNKLGKEPAAPSWRKWGALSLMNTAHSQPQYIPESSEDHTLESKFSAAPKTPDTNSERTLPTV